MGGRGPAQPHRQAAGPARSRPSAMEETEGRARSVAALPERCTAASAGPLPSFTPIHQRGRGREREGRKEGGREGGGGWRAGPGPGEGEGRAAGGLLSRSGARALAQRPRVLSLAPERSPPAPPRSPTLGSLLLRSLTRYLGRRTPPPPRRSSSVCHRSCPNALTSPRRRRPRPARKREGSRGPAAHARAGLGPGPGPRALPQGELEAGPLPSRWASLRSRPRLSSGPLFPWEEPPLLL